MDLATEPPSNTYGDRTELSESNPVSMLMYRNLSVRAEWRWGEYIPVRALYGSGSDATMGSMSLSPTGDSPAVFTGGTTALYLDEDEVTFTAVPERTRTSSPDGFLTMNARLEILSPPTCLSR